jgi:septal ring factor EnvC (AmiA/AmiB activator)
MARTKSISTIETELRKAEADLKKAQDKVDTLSERVLELQQQKQEYETRQIIDAYKRSGKTLDELLTFLNV